MEVLRSIDRMRQWRLSQPAGTRVCLVPTMGAFHAGHLALMARARQLAGRVVVSLFVNPIQFGPGEDLARYPRDFDRDAALAKAAGVDALFSPDPGDVYPPDFQTKITVERLAAGLCGAKRPGHFSGVATVVAMLFNIVRPHAAVFGEKDFQQLAVVRRLTADLHMDVDIVGHTIVRAADGLALSSRNVYLDESGRKTALFLYQGLCLARRLAAAGETEPAVLCAAIREQAAGRGDLALEYAEIVDADSLETARSVDGRAVLLLACRVGGVRLIDNGFLVDHQ